MEQEQTTQLDTPYEDDAIEIYVVSSSEEPEISLLLKAMSHIDGSEVPIGQCKVNINDL